MLNSFIRFYAENRAASSMNLQCVQLNTGAHSAQRIFTFAKGKIREDRSECCHERAW